MEANELLTWAIKELAASNKILEYIEDSGNADLAKVLDNQFRANQQLITAIRVAQMPVCMSQAEAEKYRQETTRLTCG